MTACGGFVVYCGCASSIYGNNHCLKYIFKPYIPPQGRGWLTAAKKKHNFYKSISTTVLYTIIFKFLFGGVWCVCVCWESMNHTQRLPADGNVSGFSWTQKRPAALSTPSCPLSQSTNIPGSYPCRRDWLWLWNWRLAAVGYSPPHRRCFCSPISTTCCCMTALPADLWSCWAGSGWASTVLLSLQPEI